MSHLISCYNQKTRKLEHHPVTEDIYVYVLQLEAAIMYPKESKLKNLYPHLYERQRKCNR